jgi:recombination protein RecA
MAKADKNTDKTADENSKAAALKNKDLESALSSITKQFGDGAIMRIGDENSKVPIQVIPTGSISVDIALGVGGVPRGRIIEIFGPESSGKTTLMLHIIKNAQATGGLAAFIDAEHAIDVAYATRIGVNMRDLLLSQPGSGEEALTIAETLIKSNALDVIVIDSVAALTPRAELEGQMGDSVMGAQARLMSQAMRKLTGALHKSKTCLLFTNQIREKIGVMFGNPETQPGGRALKFYASVRLDIRRKDQIKDPAGTVVGNRVKIKVVKNKVAPPFTEAEFDIMYNEGISKESSILDLATDMDVVVKKGAWLQFGGEMIGQGREAARLFLKENPKVTEKIVADVYAKRAAPAGAAAAQAAKSA